LSIQERGACEAVCAAANGQNSNKHIAQQILGNGPTDRLR
jgi:hypothetical protein